MSLEIRGSFGEDLLLRVGQRRRRKRMRSYYFYYYYCWWEQDGKRIHSAVSDSVSVAPAAECCVGTCRTKELGYWDRVLSHLSFPPFWSFFYHLLKSPSLEFTISPQRVCRRSRRALPRYPLQRVTAFHQMLGKLIADVMAAFFTGHCPRKQRTVLSKARPFVWLMMEHRAPLP